MSIPNLELENISTENNKIIGPVMSQLYVYYNNNTTLYSPEDLQKLHSIYEAKLHLCNKTDITYYINADDLLKIQSLSNDKNSTINLQIIVPNDNYEEKKRKGSPKGSPKSKEGSPKLKDRTKSESPRRKSVSRSSSADGNSKKIAKSAVEFYGKSQNSSCNKSSPTLTFLNTPDISTVTVNGIVINNKLYDVTFINEQDSDLVFSIFVIEPLGSPNKLLCKGLLDSQVNVELVSKCDSLDYTLEPSSNENYLLPRIRSIQYSVYSQTFDNFVVPTYVVFKSDKAECNTKQFVNILEQLFKLVKFEK